MSQWQDLEDTIKEYLVDDNGMTIPGSGSGKGEEDVSGISVLCQCKHSENKNITILTKDLERLVVAAALNNKYPIFASKAKDTGIVVSFMDGPVLQTLLKQAILMSLSDRLLEDIKACDNAKDLNRLETMYNNYVVPLLKTLKGNLSTRCSSITTALKNKYDDLTTVDLFDT